MRRSFRALVALAVVSAAVGATPVAQADHHEKSGDAAKPGKSEKAAAKAAMAASPTNASNVKNEMIFWIEDAEKKLGQLADAMPDDKYAWRPGEGVRSTAEVFLHVSAANFGIPSFWGVKPPEGFAFQGYEQSMSAKADVKKALMDSFAHAKAALKNATEADLSKTIKLFGGMETSVRGAYLLVLSHAHEHLGQSIAYARMNGVVPPWSAAQGGGGGEGEQNE